MGALNQEMMTSFETWKRHQLPLAPGLKAYKGATAVADPATATVKPGYAAASKIVLGIFSETIDNSANTTTTALVDVDFLRERLVLWRDNDGSITSANLFATAYVVDDHTVGASSTGKSAAGTILAVDTTLGVAVTVEDF